MIDTGTKEPISNIHEMESREFNFISIINASDAMASALNQAHVAHVSFLQVIADITNRPMHQFLASLPDIEPKGIKQ